MFWVYIKVIQLYVCVYMCVYIYILFQVLFPSRLLLQDIKYSSLCFTADSSRLSYIYSTVYPKVLSLRGHRCVR